LEEAVRARVLLDTPNKRGFTLRSELETTERVSGIRDAQLDAPSIPEDLVYLYSIFVDLKVSDVIGYSDLYAYSKITGYRFSAFEVRAIFAMDRVSTLAMMEVDKDADG
jgi:hypothetical protein